MKTIAFCGAGGTGKSTTAEFLGCNLPSPVSSLRAHFFGSDAKFGEFKHFQDIFDWQYRILYAQIAMEDYFRLVYKATENYIPVERSVVDYAAYMLNQCERYQKNPKCFEKIEEYTKWCVEHANKSYDFVVYFPPNKFKPGDSEGSTKERDEASIKKTDRYIKLLLEEVKVPILRLESTELEARAEEIVRFVEKKRK